MQYACMTNIMLSANGKVLQPISCMHVCMMHVCMYVCMHACI